MQKDFKYGHLSLKDIPEKLKQARNYPNYVKSLISLLEIKAMITEDFQDEIQQLNQYLEEDYSISKEDYKEVLDAITRIKNQIDEKKIVNHYYDSQEDTGSR